MGGIIARVGKETQLDAVIEQYVEERQYTNGVKMLKFLVKAR